MAVGDVYGAFFLNLDTTLNIPSRTKDNVDLRSACNRNEFSALSIYFYWIPWAIYGFGLLFFLIIVYADIKNNSAQLEKFSTLLR